MGDVPTYHLGAVPPILLTRQQLRQRGERPNDPRRPDAYLLVPLFDASAATAVDEQSADVPADDMVPADHGGRKSLAQWAAEILHDPQTVVLALKCVGAEGRILEVAAVRTDGEVVLDTLVYPDGVPIDSRTSAECGITEDMVAGVEVAVFGDLCDRLVELLAESRVVFWDSSARFGDRLSAEAARLGLREAFGTDDGKYEDVLPLYARWLGESRTAGEYRLHVSGGAHSALADCCAVLSKLQQMTEAPDGSGPTGATGVRPSKRRLPEVWTEREELELDTFVAEGKSPEDIGRLLGHTTNSVRWRMFHRGLGPSPASTRNQAKPMPKYTFDELRRVHPNSHKRWTDEEDARLAQRASEGASLEELIREFGRNRNAITARLERHTDPQS